MDYADLYALQSSRLAGVVDDITSRNLSLVAQENSHGKQPEWQAAIDGLPALQPSLMDFGGSAVRIGASRCG